MHDPFPFQAPPLLKRLVDPLATSLSLPTLTLHIHELLFATIAYHLICTFLSPLLSTFFFPRIYPSLPPRAKLNWDVHVVSLTQAVAINSLALWVMWVDEERGSMGWEERVWGYDGAGGMIQGFAAGYFLWDLLICVRNVGLFGWGLLAHAVAALVVFSLGFRPFVNFYGPTFILYELSSPFLNIHWFFDKLHMTGSRAQWYNGILLLLSFFSCRLLWGTYQSVRVYQDVWAGLHHVNNGRGFESELNPGIMSFATGDKVPVWLAIVYLGSNVVLNTLNFYWFGKMIETVRGRFRDPKTKGAKVKGAGEVGLEGMDGAISLDGDAEWDLVLPDEKGGAGEWEAEGKGEEASVYVDYRGKQTVEIQKKEVRKRKG